ncbi:MAG TPA: protein phosphatase [Pseudomonas sp.]|nr:protein phosphatase [Pseudomonas sp.]
MTQHPFDLFTAADLPGALIFTPCPGTRGTDVAGALATLQAAGACAVVTLMPTSELADNEADTLPELCAAHGLEWFQLPVPDEQNPGEAFDAQWARHRPRVLALLDEGRRVAIHCKGGSGRTGLIAARILIERGVPRERAIGLVQALRSKAIRHPAHAAWIAQFEAGQA